MELAQRTLERLEELAQCLPIAIKWKTLFVAGEPTAPWASCAILHMTREHAIYAASFDLVPDVETAAQGLASQLLAIWGEPPAGEQIQHAF